MRKPIIGFNSPIEVQLGFQGLAPAAPEFLRQWNEWRVMLSELYAHDLISHSSAQVALNRLAERIRDTYVAAGFKEAPE